MMATKESAKTKREDMCQFLKTMQVSSIWVFLCGGTGSGGQRGEEIGNRWVGVLYAPEHVHLAGWTHVHVTVSAVSVIHYWARSIDVVGRKVCETRASRNRPANAIMMLYSDDCGTISAILSQA
jgi:hypothetical protein